jgi:hypothetical protein
MASGNFPELRHPMDSAAHHTIRRALSRTLAPSGGDRANASVVAEAAIHAWIRTALELTPVIGQEGVRALYARCMVLARSTYPWLPASELSASQAKALADLRQSLEGREPAEALEASIAFLTLVAELLGALIGEALTTRLLRSAWGNDVPDPTTQEPPR